MQDSTNISIIWIPAEVLLAFSGCLLFSSLSSNPILIIMSFYHRTKAAHYPVSCFFHWNRKILLPIILIWGIIFATSYISRADDLKLDVLEMKTNCFGGRLTRATFRLSSHELFKGTLRWNLMFNKRILHRAEQSIAVKNKNVIFHADLKIPPVKENIVIPVDFVLTVCDEKNERPAISYSKRLWIFSEHPFRSLHKQLKNLNINLFDPRKRTATLFSSADIPFKHVCCVDTLSRVTNGFVIIGEGLSLEKYRGLTEAMMSLASAGITVLCLAPDFGVFPLPSELNNGSDAIRGIHLRRHDIIHELGKHLDASLWSSGRNNGAGINGVGFRIQRNRMYGKVMQGNGWPWMEINYDKPGARLIFCGFSLLEAWEHDPAPRYLLYAIIQDSAHTNE